MTRREFLRTGTAALIAAATVGIPTDDDEDPPQRSQQ